MALDYYVDFVAHPLDLNLWEAELYFAAIPVQQLIGNLVYYSNHGRYEPRLAHKWERRNPNTWVFYLRDDLFCENGEKITGESFKKSIERSLFILSKKGGSPVLSGLIGYDDFISHNSKNDIFNLSPIEGITVESNNLIFQFTKPTRSGVVQILSFAPYGYICADNLNSDGEWKNREKFISSGPYGVEKIELGKTISLKKRNDFHVGSKSNSPENVFFHQIKREHMSTIKKMTTTVVDAGSPLTDPPKGLKRFELVKEYMSSIVVGNLKNGVFATLESRHALGSAIQQAKNEYSNKNGSYVFSDSIYPSQSNVIRPTSYLSTNANLSGKKIIIRGGEPSAKSDSYLSWVILKRALELLNIGYDFSNTSLSRSDITDQSYDIRLANPSVGGGVEAWIIDVLFCSKLNSNLPDPSGNICKSIQQYEADLVTDHELIGQVLNTIQYDAAIFPIRHFGLNLYISPDINEDSISPLLSIMRFDQTEITNE